jgi:hypothetical protein
MTRKSKAKARDEVDWNSFVNQPDTKINSDLADTTKQGLGHVQHNFQRSIHAHVVYSSLATNSYSQAYSTAETTKLQVLA